MNRPFISRGIDTLLGNAVKMHAHNNRTVFSMWIAQPATVAMQQRGEHTPTTIQALFSASSVPRSYLDDNWGDPSSCQSRVQSCCWSWQHCSKQFED
jgi:hypothetical protein